MDQSKFHSLNTGVNMNAQANYRLTRCDFSNIGHAGLISANSSGYKVEENDFSTTKPFATGINVSNSGSAENRIYKNSFSDFWKGISVAGNNSSRPALSGLQFIRNEFENNQYDIHISPDATIRSNQGSSSGGAGNRFLATNTSSIYSQSSQNITYYHCTIGGHIPYLPTNNITVIGTTLCSTNASTLCTSSRSDADSLAQYMVMQSQYDHLLAALGNNPELLQEILVLSDAMRELSDHAISRILHDSILYVDALKSWYEIVRTPIAKYWLAEVYASERNYEQAEVILRAIPPSFAYNESELFEHENYMQFHHFKKQMYLSTRDWTELDEAEIAQLQRIAEATQGRSAGMAKGALCFFYGICYEDEPEFPSFGRTEGGVNAEGQNAEGGKQKAEGEFPPFGGTEGGLYELSLYPNPTSSETTVATNNPAVKIIKLEIFDIYGKCVSLQTLNHFYGTLKMNELVHGIYILKVRLDNEDVVFRKIVKQ